MTGDTLNNSDNVASVQWLVLIRDFLLLDQKKSLSFDFDVIILLLWGALLQTSTSAETSIITLSVTGITATSISDILALLLLLLLALLAPNLINIEELNSNKITLKSSVSVLTSANENVCIQEIILSGHVGITTVLLVDTEDTGNELAVAE